MTSLDSPPANCGADALYRRALDRGIFLIQRCGGCERAVFHPRMICPIAAPTVCLVRAGRRRRGLFDHRGAAQAEAGGDYNVALVDLKEGVRLMSRVEGVPPEAVRIGMSVRARIASENGQGLLVFAPQQEAT